MMRRLSHISGYTLIELSIVIMLLGVIAGSALHIAAESLESDRLEESEHILDNVEFALRVYFKQHQTLPCPARSDLPVDDADFGIAQYPCVASSSGIEYNADSEAVWGALPVKSLGIPLDYAFDSWNQQILYVLQSDYTEPNPPFGPAVTNQLDDGSNPFNTDRLTIIDNFDNEMQSNEPDNGIAYILVSFGKDKLGSISKSGAAAPDCSTTTLDAENCDGDLVFRDAAIVDTQNDATYFYDLIRWKSRYNFKG